MIYNILKGVAVLWSVLRALVITALIFTTMNVTMADTLHIIVFALVYLLVWMVDVFLSLALADN